MTAILMHGGGIDSTAIFMMLVSTEIPFRAIHVDHGQQSSRMERKCVVSQCKEHDVPFSPVTLPPPVSGRSLWKGRNAFLLTYAFTQSNTVYTGLTDGCVFADSSIEFVESFEAMVRTFNPAARLISPVQYWSKAQEYRFIKTVDPDARFWTCYGKGPKPCGKCGHCHDLKQIITWDRTGKTVFTKSHRKYKSLGYEKDEELSI